MKKQRVESYSSVCKNSICSYQGLARGCGKAGSSWHWAVANQLASDSCAARVEKTSEMQMLLQSSCKLQGVKGSSVWDEARSASQMSSAMPLCPSEVRKCAGF